MNTENNKKGFFARWKKGIADSTPSQQMYAKMVGHIGSVFGISLATVFLWLNGMWYFVLFMAFTVWLQYIEFIRAKQMWKAHKKMEESMEYVR